MSASPAPARAGTSPLPVTARGGLRASRSWRSPLDAGISAYEGDPRSLLLVLSGEASFGGDDLAWQRDGVCGEIGLDLFFPELGDTAADAKSACRRCPVRRDCLLDALRRPGLLGTGGYGCWGGTSPEERDELLRRFGDDLEAAADFALRDEPASPPVPQPREKAA